MDEARLRALAVFFLNGVTGVAKRRKFEPLLLNDEHCWRMYELLLAELRKLYVPNAQPPDGRFYAHEAVVDALKPWPDANPLPLADLCELDLRGTGSMAYFVGIARVLLLAQWARTQGDWAALPKTEFLVVHSHYFPGAWRVTQQLVDELYCAPPSDPLSPTAVLQAVETAFRGVAATNALLPRVGLLAVLYLRAIVQAALAGDTEPQLDALPVQPTARSAAAAVMCMERMGNPQPIRDAVWQGTALMLNAGCFGLADYELVRVPQPTSVMARLAHDIQTIENAREFVSYFRQCGFAGGEEHDPFIAQFPPAIFAAAAYRRLSLDEARNICIALGMDLEFVEAFFI